ncbi:30S ribosome-binding factor RbfA [Flaviaesturariibacter aridisoli]|uniref:Ribosome-binding factor A n=1 Tax=Flaviaesturariibacter aridisoli TaxID=2545761 RepID=A0A4R4E2D8_9BACT|nr:30S ribosome-binding factor RbfA [Flaviaesturariibacter aridisoli]TCZ73616.1 30S ribosome-binding factor RbfA [Flaviaesturariibacter aridisoli]
MQEGKRQKQVAGLIQEEVNDIFRRLGMAMMDGGMVSVSGVKITPDLLEARIYLSFFQVADPKATHKKINERAWEVKRELAARIKTQVRRMPELRFFYDDTLDHVFKMENLFDQIKKEDEARGKEEEGGEDAKPGIE